MKKQYFTLFVTLLIAAAVSHAQGWKQGLKVVRRSGTETAYKTTEITRQITDRVRVQRPLFGKPVLTSLEPNIRRFIFTVAPQGQTSGFKGSGFVFAEKYQGKTVLWGASAAHVVRHMGKNVTITFHVDGKEISFPATVELTGRGRGLNAALIKLPEEAAQVALPIELSNEAVSPEETVFTYGFSAGTYKKTVRNILIPGTERLLADFPRFGAPKPGFCGSLVLNEKGRAVGIETGGYELNHAPWGNYRGSFLTSSNARRVSEIVPVHHLDILLKEFHTPKAGGRVILFRGQKIGILGTDELITHISVHYQDGSLTMLERSPLWEPMFLEQAVPHLQKAEAVQIVIDSKTEGQYLYYINLQNNTVTRKEF